MKAFLIKFNEQEIRVPINENGVTTIHTYDNDGKSFLYVGALNERTSEHQKWYDFTTIGIGDIVEIDLLETNDMMTQPSSIIKDNQLIPKKSKIDLFYELENDLRKRGLI